MKSSNALYYSLMNSSKISVIPLNLCIFFLLFWLFVLSRIGKSYVHMLENKIKRADWRESNVRWCCAEESENQVWKYSVCIHHHNYLIVIDVTQLMSINFWDISILLLELAMTSKASFHEIVFYNWLNVHIERINLFKSLADM